MRMHRGSSKDARSGAAPSEILPLSASPPLIEVEVEVARAAHRRVRRLTVAPGVLVREVVRSIGETPEGCAVLDGETPLPLDTPLERPVRLTVVPTFSGG